MRITRDGILCVPIIERAKTGGMAHLFDDSEVSEGGRRGWLLGIVMFAALLLMAATFIWAIVQIDPLVQDFIPGASPATTTPVPAE